MKYFDNIGTYQAWECPFGYVCFQQKNSIMTSPTEEDCELLDG